MTEQLDLRPEAGGWRLEEEQKLNVEGSPLPPLRGLRFASRRTSPRLTPWAKDCRRSATRRCCRVAPPSCLLPLPTFPPPRVPASPRSRVSSLPPASSLQPPASSAFTLLEIILALSITVVIVAAITAAIHIHMRLVDAGRETVERAQLGRTLLNRIGDDFRGAVRYEPQDVAALLPGGGLIQNVAGAAGTAAAAGADAGSIAGATGTAGQSGQLSETGSGGSSGSGSEDSTGTPEEEVAVPTVGVRLDEFGLHVDVSRIPREDELRRMAARGGNVVHAASDLKRITYFVDAQGLWRLETPLTEALLSDLENTQPIPSRQDLLAPEVKYFEVKFFDGAEWYFEWDTVELGGLPLMVELVVVFWGRDEERSFSSTPALSGEEQNIHRLIVHLPAAEATAEGLAGETTEEPAEESSDSSAPSGSGSTTGSGSGGTGGGGTGGTNMGGSQ